MKVETVGLSLNGFEWAVARLRKLEVWMAVTRAAVAMAVVMKAVAVMVMAAARAWTFLRRVLRGRWDWEAEATEMVNLAAQRSSCCGWRLGEGQSRRR